MFDFEKTINNKKVAYNFTLDLANTLTLNDLYDKINLDETMEIVKQAKVDKCVDDPSIILELRKELGNCLRVCSRLSNKRKTVTLKDLAIEGIQGHYALHGLELNDDVINRELEDLKLRFNSSATQGINKNSLLDIDGNIKKKYQDKKLIDEVSKLGEYVKKNCQEYEIALWNTIYEQFEKNPRNKKNRVAVREYYDFLTLSDYELATRYGSSKANEIIDTYSTRLLRYC